MGKNIIFVFSGTGNSLWAAKENAKTIEDCELVSMGNCTRYSLEGGYDTIGFVYPTYYRGIPAKVREFVLKLDLRQNKNAYFYAVATLGGAAHGGNSIVQLNRLLKGKGITLGYAEHLDMFSNYIILYNMSDTVEQETQQSAEDLRPIIQKIRERSTNRIRAIPEPVQQLAYQGAMLLIPHMDKNFNVSDACIKCGICKKVCPVGNIELGQDGEPAFQHHCEQCMGCIQHCPAKAINYKNRTQNRKRYTHPNVTWKELALLNGYTQTDGTKS